MLRVRFGRIVTPHVVAPLGAAALLVAAAAHAQEGSAPPPPPTTAAPTPAASTPAAAPTPAPVPVAAPAPLPPVKAGASTAAPAKKADAKPATKSTAKPLSAEEKRDRGMRESLTVWGPTGLLHLPSAMTGPAETFRVGVFLDWFAKNDFLCNSTYTCGTATSDKARHIGASAIINATIIDGLEAYMAARVYANSNDPSVSRPSLLQVLGDTTLGLKYVAALSDGLINLGGGGEVLFLNGTGGIGLAGNGTSFRLRALSTFALDKLPDPIPVRFHLGLGYLFDRSGNLVEDIEQQRSDRTGTTQKISRVERFGLGINKVDRFEIGLGAEGLFVDDKVRPFLEYNLGLPVNRQSYSCPQPTVAADGTKTSDGCLAKEGFSAFPSKLTIGVKAFPFDGGFSGIGFVGAVDVGVTGTSTFISEVAPTAPYTVWLGLTLASDTVPKTKIVEKKVEKIVEVGPTLVKVHGIVHEAGTNTPIPNAIVSYVGVNLPPLASAADGVFGDDVAPGTYQLSVKADGYKDGTCGGTAVAGKKPEPPKPGTPPSTTPPAPNAPSTLEVDCALEALPRVGSATITFLDAETGAPIVGAIASVSDENGANEKQFNTDSSGVVRIGDLTPGTWYAKIDATGYLTTRASLDIVVRQDAKATVHVRARPKDKDKLVVVEKKEIKIKQQVLFETGKATILPASSALLQEVADVIIHNPQVGRIEIQGHTDNTGDKSFNMELSAARAAAVKAYLVKLGVDGSRLDTKGFGDTKPVAANATDAGRQKNRRVQFMLVDAK
jgi:outer membrane protein OmpA-like peptidoglycan-associated protein